jgi:K+-sensing histidine kinase KdpD
MTGLQLLEKIRANPAVKDIPVIMVTAMVSPKDLSKAFEKGVTDYIKKPVEKIELLSRARAALQSYNYLLTINQQKKELGEMNHQLALAHQKLKGLNDIKTIFFSVLSNDINEPLNSLKAFVKLLFKNINNFSKEEMKYVADNIKASLNDVSSLLKNLVKWSDHEIYPRDKNITFSRNIDLKILLKKQLKEVEEDLIRKQIQIEDRTPENAYFEAEPESFSNFLGMFIECCSRFISKKGIISFYQQEKDSIEIRIEGFKISPAMLPALFSLDYYINNSINPYEKGAGLGFVLCKNYLLESGYSIELSSQIEEDVHFLITPVSKQELAELS